MKHTRVVSTKCTPGFACRAFSDTTLVCFNVNEHTTKCSRYISKRFEWASSSMLHRGDDYCPFVSISRWVKFPAPSRTGISTPIHARVWKKKPSRVIIPSKCQMTITYIACWLLLYQCTESISLLFFRYFIISVSILNNELNNLKWKKDKDNDILTSNCIHS